MFPDDSASKSEAEEGEQREDADEATETTTKRKNSLQKSSHRVYWIGSKSPNSSTAAAMMTRKESSENASERLVLQDFPQCAIRLQPFNLQ